MAPLCLLVTPYGIAGLSYYRETLLNPAFKALVVEWLPVTSAPILAVPFFLAASATVWVLLRSRGRTSLFEALALLVLIAGAISAVRNITWFALALMMLMPSMLGTSLTPRAPAPRRPRLNITLAGTSVVFLLAVMITVSTKPGGWFESGYDVRALDQAAAAVHHQPTLHIYAGGHLADWLLWHDPALAGHLAYDSRLELLTSKQLRELVDIGRPSARGARSVLAGYGLLVLETPNRTSRLLLEDSGARVVLRGHGVAVAAISTSGATVSRDASGGEGR